MATESESTQSQEWTALLSSKKRIDREKGLAALKTLLTPDISEEDKKSIESHVISLLTTLVGPWEDKHGGLMAAALILESGVASSDFTAQVKSVLPILLEEEESRVRIAAGEGRGLVTMGTRGFSRPVGMRSG